MRALFTERYKKEKIMEQNVRAFFYDYKYYLFPESCQTLADLKKLTRVYARRLKEEGCMAPNFTYESIIDETVEIEDPNRLFEQSVNLYSQAEYDEILAKQVNARCISCSRFVQDDKPLDLTGHHREMALNGVCYEKEEKDDYWSFSTCADVFWYRVSKQLGTLAALISKGDQKKLNKILNAELNRFYYPIEFYGAKEAGKYHLYLSISEKNRTGIVISNFLAAVACTDGNEMKEAGWTVHPYIPAHVRKYKYKEKDFTLSYGTAENGNPNLLAVYIYHPKAEKLPEKKANKLMSHVAKSLSYELGEDVFMSVVYSLAITSEKRTFATMSEICDKFREKYRDAQAENNGSRAPEENADDFLPPFFYAKSEEDENVDSILPYRKEIAEGMTIVPEVAFVDREILKEKQWWMDFASFIYLYIPRNIDGVENAFQTLGWYIQNSKLVPEPLRNPNDTGLSGLSIGLGVCAEKGFVFDNLIFDEKRFFRTLRILAPVLRSYDAKMVVVNEGGVMAYSCDYDFTPLDIE